MTRTVGKLVTFLLALMLLASCSQHRFRYQTDPEIAPLLHQAAVYPETRFLVLSDPHVFRSELGTSGSAFEAMMDTDRKMLPLSEEILATAIADMASEPADFVLVCGDLTKDGEIANHRRFKELMTPLVRSGKRIFVVPGNHDVANGYAFRYSGAKREKVAALESAGFAAEYTAFGYGHALSRDTDSLSYMAEAAPGLWLLALDSCRWKENPPDRHPITGGALSQNTLSWIEECLILAKKQNRAVIACMHHGLIEHYAGNADHYPDYLVAGHPALTRLLASYGVRLLFSGHFHAQDISGYRLPGTDHFIFDIETGSPVTYPCPWRSVEIDARQQAHVNSFFVEAIPSRPSGFSSWAQDFLFHRTVLLAEKKLEGYGVAADDRTRIAPVIARALTAHTRGDESGPAVLLAEEEHDALGLWGKVVLWTRKSLLIAWQRDLPPADNRLTIDLSTGGTSPLVQD